MIYISTPKDIDLKFYRKMVRALKEQFPTREIFEPRKQFKSFAMWALHRRTVLKRCDAFILLPDKNGWIGSGCCDDYLYFSETKGEEYILVMTPDGVLHTTYDMKENRYTDGWTKCFQMRIQGYYGDPREKATPLEIGHDDKGYMLVG